VKFIEKKTKKEITFVSTSADEVEGMLRTRLNWQTWIKQRWII